MNDTEWIVLLVEVGVVALAALLRILGQRGVIAGVTPFELLFADAALAATLGIVVGALWVLVQIVAGTASRGRHVRRD